MFSLDNYAVLLRKQFGMLNTVKGWNCKGVRCRQTFPQLANKEALNKRRHKDETWPEREGDSRVERDG